MEEKKKTLEKEAAQKNEAKKDNSFFAGFAIILNFGISLALRLFILGDLLGGYLDEKFFNNSGVVPIVMILLAIFLSLRQLYYMVK